jgi:hypothetical protein
MVARTKDRRERDTRRTKEDDKRPSRGSRDSKDDPDDDDPDDDVDDEPDDDDDDGESFTQAEVDEIIRKRVGKTKRQSAAAVAKELGFDSIDDVKAALEAKAATPKPKAKKAASDDNEEVEVDAEAIRNEAKADADKRVAEMELTTRIKDIIQDEYPSVTRSQAEKIRKLLEDVTVKSRDDDILDALEDLEDEFPSMFKQGEEEDDDGPEPDANRRPAGRRNRSSRRDRPSSTPGRSPRSRRGKPVNHKTAATALLHERHPKTKK